MIRRVTDLVRRAKVSGHSVVGKSWKIFKVPKRAASQDYLFPMYRERDTAPLRWQKILSPDTGSYGLTRRLFVWQGPHELEDRWPVTGILSMGLRARVVTCAFDLKSTSCKTGENDRSMISSSLGWLCRQSGGESREKNFSKKLKNFLSIFHPLWRISHLLYIERGTRHLWDGKKF